MSSPSEPELPRALVLDILACNGTAVSCCTARQVCREAYLDAVRRAGRGQSIPCTPRRVWVPAHDLELPLWLLQQMWLRTHPFFKPKLLEARAVAGDVQGVEWLLDQGCPHSPTICTAAAGAGQLQVLGLLRFKGLPWDAATAAAAARGGHIAILTWLRSQSPPCPFDEEACFEAASAGQLGSLQLLRALGAPWCGATCLAAALRGDLQLLIWLRAQEPPCPWACGVRAAASGKPEVLRWLKMQAAP